MVDRNGIVRFLDDLRAAEAAAAEVFRAWIAVCTLDGLRGGLRAIAEREAGHAELLAERLRELGASCTATVAEPVRASAIGRFGATGVGDDEKLALFLARYIDDAAATRPIAAVLDQLEDDPETRELLRLVADGEAATVGWLRAYHAGLRRPASTSR
jgi:hypothetical protein